MNQRAMLTCILFILAPFTTQSAEMPGGIITTLPDPYAPATKKSGPCVIRYIESVPDEHLQLAIKQTKGQILLSDLSKIHLQGCTYTINNWTDPDDPSQLKDEPIKAYTLYQVTKMSIAAPIREWWRSSADFQKDHPLEIHRSEVFFVVTPSNETWNGVGDGINPIGRPIAFGKLPAFALTNRVYGFDGAFPDETEARLNDLDITFNRKSGQKHTMIYSSAIESFMQTKGYDKEPHKPIHEFSDQDCIDFADSLPKEGILAFDFEPPEGWRWTTDYQNPNFAVAMSKVVARLNERGIKAYNWLGSPQFSLDGQSLQGFKNWGNGNEKMDLFLKAHAEPGQVHVDPTPNAVINLGFGYDSYDFDFLPSDTGNQNSSPQALYLKELDACELARQTYPDRELLAFTWAFMEFDVGTFPPNHVVKIPTLNAEAQRFDNKPIYSPSSWQDSMTLAMVYCRYMYYWGGGASWDPVYSARYTKKNLSPGEMETWRFIKGETPEVHGPFYAGKESLIFNSTITAAYRYSQLQTVCDNGLRLAAATTYRRADKAGKPGVEQHYPEYKDGSQFIQSAKNKQPFTLVITNPGTKKNVVFFQDIWSRPGQWTDFSFTLNGKTYTQARNSKGKITPLRTNGNRLFVGLIE